MIEISRLTGFIYCAYYEYDIIEKRYSIVKEWSENESLTLKDKYGISDSNEFIFNIQGDLGNDTESEFLKIKGASSVLSFPLFLNQRNYSDFHSNNFGMIVFISPERYSQIEMHKLWILNDFVEIITNAIQLRGQEFYLEGREKYLNAIVENTTEVIITISKGGFIDNIPSTWTELTGYDYNETYGHHYSAFVNENYISLLRDYLNRRNRETSDYGKLVLGKKEIIEVKIRHKDGHFIWIRLMAAVFGDERFTFFTCMIENITESKGYREMLEYLSYHDKLTGIFNRAYLEHKLLEIDCEENLPISILIGDVNGLKITNDVFGHSKGDLLLKSVAARLKGICPENSIVARWGGDEFIAVLPKTYESQSLEIIKNFNETRMESVHPDEIIISVSFGHKTKTVIKEKMATIITDAESIMYKAKLFESKSHQSEILDSLMKYLYEKSNETYEHCERIAFWGKLIGEKLNLNDIQQNDLQLLAKLHDIGKVSIEEDILNKPGGLTDDEYEKIKAHSETGYRIAKASSQFAKIADYILYHHEKWDGSGYPSGLKGDQIPLLSRIIAIADAYDAMTNHRPYKPVLSDEESKIELINGAGVHFDPKLVNIFIKLLDKPNYK